MTPTRGQLHAWIWQVPVTRLAEALQMSSKALIRTCVKLRIPTPPRGHWRRVETGQAVVPSPLPDVDVSEEPALEVDEAAVEALLADRAAMSATECEAAASRNKDGIAGSRAPVKDAEQAVSHTLAQGPVCPPDSQFLVEPCSASVLEMADRHGRWVLAEAFLEEVRRGMRACDPSTRAVLTLWLQRARETLAATSPAAQVTSACERVALGEEEPAWWSSATGNGR